MDLDRRLEAARPNRSAFPKSFVRYLNPCTGDIVRPASAVVYTPSHWPLPYPNALVPAHASKAAEGHRPANHRPDRFLATRHHNSGRASAANPAHANETSKMLTAATSRPRGNPRAMKQLRNHVGRHIALLYQFFRGRVVGRCTHKVSRMVVCVPTFKPRLTFVHLITSLNYELLCRSPECVHYSLGTDARVWPFADA